MVWKYNDSHTRGNSVVEFGCEISAPSAIQLCTEINRRGSFSSDAFLLSNRFVLFASSTHTTSAQDVALCLCSRVNLGFYTHSSGDRENQPSTFRLVHRALPIRLQRNRVTITGSPFASSSSVSSLRRLRVTNVVTSTETC